MDFKIGVIALILGSFGMNLVTTLDIDRSDGRITETGGELKLTVQKGSSMDLTVNYKGNASVLLSKAVIWMFQKYGSTIKLEISSNGELTNDLDTSKFASSIHCSNNVCKVKITVKDMQDEDGGSYIVEVREKKPPKNMIDTTRVEVIVLNPVEELVLKISKVDDSSMSEKITATQADNNKMKKVNLDHGTYRVECTAKRSNPEPTVFISDTNGARLTGSKEKIPVSGELRRFSQKFTSTVNIEKNSEGKSIQCRGVVEDSPATAVITSIQIRQVITRDAKIMCENSSAILGDKNRHIICTVRIDDGPIMCSDAVWRQGEMLYNHKSENPKVEVKCKKLNDTMLETQLIVRKVVKGTFKETYVFEFQKEGYSSVRKENQINQYFSGASHICSFTSILVCVALVLFRKLL